MGIMMKNCQDPEIKQSGFNGKKKRAGVFIHCSHWLKGLFLGGFFHLGLRRKPWKIDATGVHEISLLGHPAEPPRVQTLSLREV